MTPRETNPDARRFTRTNMRLLLLAIVCAASAACSSADFSVASSPDADERSTASADTQRGEREASVDAAEGESATAEDTDIGAIDSGMPAIDSGTVAVDSGTVAYDSGTVDTGTAIVDTGTVLDTAPACTVSSCPASTNPCKMPACVGGACGFAPKPKGTFCNAFADQCDGLGNCVDCTDNGGCGECCVCMANKCTPA